VSEWLAQKLQIKSDDERETQAARDIPAHTFTQHRYREFDPRAPRPVLDWITDKAIQTQDSASEAQPVRDWLDMRLKRQPNHAPAAASAIAREWLASRQLQEKIQKEEEKPVRGGPSYDLER
jgi:hypothetical protein